MENLLEVVPHIPIINYHKIEVDYDIGITTRTPQQFEQDLIFLKKNHFHTITFNDLLKEKQLPLNPIIITFDDAYQSFYKIAYPLLRQYGFKSIIYAPLDYLGQWNDWDVQYYGKRYKHISKEELLEVNRGGMEIGSHTFSHRLLTKLDIKSAEKEIRGSKDSLEELLNEEIVSIGYPFSRFDNRIIELTRKAGYSFGVASLFMRSLKEEDRIFALKRLNIYRIDGKRSFSKKASRKNAGLLIARDWLIQKGGLATNIHQALKEKRKTIINDE